MHRNPYLIFFDIVANTFEFLLEMLQTGCDAKGTRSELILKNRRLFLTLNSRIFLRHFKLFSTFSTKFSSE
jgi:hypothetical protein